MKKIVLTLSLMAFTLMIYAQGPAITSWLQNTTVTGTYYVQALQWDWRIAIAGLAPGLLAVGLLVVNNLRDIDEDRIANKRTLAVRFGATFSRIQYVLCIVLAAAVPCVLWLLGMKVSVLIASLVIVPGAIVCVKVWRNNGIDLRPCLGMTAGLLLLYSVLFCIGLVAQ